MKLFRDLSAKQEASFRQWARDNYRPFEPIKGVWHPCIQDECVKINKEEDAMVRNYISEGLGE